MAVIYLAVEEGALTEAQWHGEFSSAGERAFIAGAHDHSPLNFPQTHSVHQTSLHTPTFFESFPSLL
ncbi:MAG: hypothetical protein ACKO9H_08545, partial [Planctomycetota bacterium]